MNKPTTIIIHCSDVSERTHYDQFNSINNYHRDERGFPVSSKGIYVGYHYLITGGKVYDCKADTDVGAHCNQHENGVSMNFQSIGICWGGDGDVEYPSTKHYELLQKKVWELQDKYGIPPSKVKFHRAYATSKTCPGSLLNEAWLTILLTRPKPPLDEKLNSCLATVETQKVEIGKWKGLWRDLIEYIKLANK